MSKVLVVYCLLYDDKDNRVLMVYNKDTESWSLPGGVVEDTETLEQAVLREVHEETDLMVEIKDLVAVNEYIFPDNRQHTVLFTFRGEIVGGYFMLICYSFRNFRSFRKTTQLSMKAGRQTTYNENLIKEAGMRILPSAVIYGANASGKTNIIMSLALMREIVSWGTLDASSPYLANMELYPFAYNPEPEPVQFQAEFINNGRRYLYSIEVMVKPFQKDKRKIVSEQLWVNSGNKLIQVFERDLHRVAIKRDRKVLSLIQYDEKLLAEFENRININLDPAKLFLAHGFKTLISSDMADDVIDFFTNKLFVINDFALSELNISLMFSEIPEEGAFIWNDILDRFIKCADFGPQKIVFKPQEKEGKSFTDVQLYSLCMPNGLEKPIMIPAEWMESRGTLKLLDFAIPFTDIFKAGGVFVLDEFDAVIHPELIKGIIALFNDRSFNEKGAQLIFTTHNPIYMSNRIFRRDQIKFVERDKDTYESTIHSLADFGSEEVRNDENYLINYFRGKYSTLPYIDFRRLFNLPDNVQDPSAGRVPRKPGR